MPNLRRLSSSCLWVVALGCQSAPRAPVDGWGPEGAGAARDEERERRPAPRLVAIPAERRARWERLEEPMRQLPGRGPSEHGDGLERTVAVNEAAAVYAQLAAPDPLPAGALILQRHHRPGEAAVVSIYAMFKGSTGAWEFVVLDEQERVAARGRLAPCARCHHEAPFDALFGPPPP